MRIIGGDHKGRIVKPPAGLDLRPTTDLARESLFNILSNRLYFEELKVLDLFAGTGSISYEFISRGASLVHAVEIKPRHAFFIRQTSQEYNMTRLKVYISDARKFIGRLSFKYDLIFADPPYDLKWLPDIPSMIFDNECLAQNGLFILEHPKDYDFSNHTHWYEHRKYGSVNFTFFRMPS